jgi:hypothetical protein
MPATYHLSHGAAKIKEMVYQIQNPFFSSVIKIDGVRLKRQLFKTS